MSTQRVKVGHRFFPSVAAASLFYSALLKRYSTGEAHVLEGQDADDVLALPFCHYNAAEKIGAGIESVGVMKKSFNAYSFVFNQVGVLQPVDFSYKKCFGTSPLPRDFFRAACRASVTEAVAAVKRQYFTESQNSAGLVPCRATGALISFADAHVDHVLPKSFAQLVDDFLAQYPVDLTQVKYVDLESGGKGFKDPSMAESFRKWHAEHAVLRVISRAENLRTAHLAHLPVVGERLPPGRSPALGSPPHPLPAGDTPATPPAGR